MRSDFRRILELLSDDMPALTSRQIAKILGMSQQRAGSILQFLIKQHQVERVDRWRYRKTKECVRV